MGPSDFERRRRDALAGQRRQEHLDRPRLARVAGRAGDRHDAAEVDGPETQIKAAAGRGFLGRDGTHGHFGPNFSGDALRRAAQPLEHVGVVVPPTVTGTARSAETGSPQTGHLASAGRAGTGVGGGTGEDSPQPAAKTANSPRTTKDREDDCDMP